MLGERDIAFANTLVPVVFVVFKNSDQIEKMRIFRNICLLSFDIYLIENEE